MTMHGKIVLDVYCFTFKLLKYVYRRLSGLVAMRVNALLGGGNRVKTFLWAIWLIYSVSTLGLLGVGLWKGYSTFQLFLSSSLDTFPLLVIFVNQDFTM